MNKEIKKLLSNWIEGECLYDDGVYEWYKIKCVVPTHAIENILTLKFRCFFNNNGQIAISKRKVNNE